jgi:hypothetical protein
MVFVPLLMLAVWRVEFSDVCSLVHPFEKIFEVVEPTLPEPRHLAGPVDQRSQGAELCTIVGPTTFMSVANQTSALQDPKVL